MGRIKTISDEVVLDTVLELLMDIGPDRMTFVRAGNAAGLSPATLVQRYGNREALLEATLLRAWDLLDAQTEAADSEEPLTSEGAIRILLRLMPPEAAERNATDGLLLLREDIRNPVLRARGAAWSDYLCHVLGKRLGDNAQLGRQMANVWMGAQTWWAFNRNGTAEAAIRQALDEWLGNLRLTVR
jgi:AcrR family transcriptional regulator